MIFEILIPWAPLLGLVISGVYFFSAPATENVWRKIVTSMHGLWIAGTYFSAMQFWGIDRYRPGLEMPFDVALLMAVLLIVLTLILFRGPKLLHALQLVNLALLAETWFIGTMAMTGKYL